MVSILLFARRDCCFAHAAIHGLTCHVSTPRQVLKKMLKAVELLPISADDLHLTRSAHGTFADMLQQLTSHPEAEVRTEPQPRMPSRAHLVVCFSIRHGAAAWTARPLGQHSSVLCSTHHFCSLHAS